ncbi:PEGA domain protein [anaerobic digester metagenome]
MPSTIIMSQYRTSCLVAVLVLFLTALAVPVMADGETGLVRITSSPGGVLVYVDDIYRGVTAVQSGQSATIEVTAGTQHNLRASKQGYQDYETTFSVNAGQLNEISVTLPSVTQTSIFGTIQVQSVPAGANVYIDGQFHGTTPSQAGSYLSQDVIAGKHIVSVQLDGYVTYSTTVQVLSGERKSVVANLNQDRPDGSIQVRTSPEGATVVLDGIDLRTSPVTFANVNAGTHTIIASRDGYQSVSRSVQVSAGQTAQVDITLNPIGPSYGSARIQSVPSSADVYIDGLYRGATPVTIGNLGIGTHNVLLRHAGFQEYSTTIQVSVGSTTEIRPTLTALPPTSGSVDVVSYPAGASVYIDGAYHGQTSSWDALDIPNVAPGDHSCTLTLGGYYDYVTTISVTAGRTTNVVATLKDLPTTNPHGQVAVVSSPSGAGVYIDNVYRGITPLTVRDVPKNSHTILIRQAGYQDWTTSVQVQEGETAQVSASLVPEGGATTTTATSAVTSNATTALPTSTTAAPTTTKAGLIEGLALAGVALAGHLIVRSRR